MLKEEKKGKLNSFRFLKINTYYLSNIINIEIYKAQHRPYILHDTKLSKTMIKSP